MIPLKQIPGVFAIPVEKDAENIHLTEADPGIEIIGTVTADEIDFDTKLFTEKQPGIFRYKDYV